MRKRMRKRKRGGALFVRKPRLIDKIAEAVSMFVSGPSPTFATAGAKLGAQAAKGVADNVKYYKQKRYKRR